MNVFVLLTQRKIFWRTWETEQFWGTIDFHSIFFPTMEVNGAPEQPGYKLSSKYLPLCSAEQRNSYRFGTTWGWVNDDRIFIFGWTIPLSRHFGDLYFTGVIIFQPTFYFYSLHFHAIICTFYSLHFKKKPRYSHFGLFSFWLVIVQKKKKKPIQINRAIQIEWIWLWLDEK